MTFSHKIIGIIGLTLLESVIGFAQENTSNQTKKITACPFQLAESGRAANFRLGFTYRLEVDATGKVLKLDEISNYQRQRKFKFVRDELFVDCMKQWQLEPAGKYFVSFYVGTTSVGVPENMPQNYLKIIDPNKKAIIVELSFSENDVLKIDEPKKEQ
jgi:hypothetical protein